jgi:hypothetical protein
VSRRSRRPGRPWRAVAYLPGPPRWHLSRTAAASREGLDRFVAQWQEVGATVEVWEVIPHPAISAAAERSAVTR